jgi:hypothetical protein
MCDAVQPAKRNGDIACNVCGHVEVEMDPAGRGYCAVCQEWQPLEHEALFGEDVTGQFIGGDILCGHCRFVIATVFKPDPIQS